MLAAITAAHIRGRGSVSSKVRKKAHRASVMVSVSVTSGIRIRVNRNKPTQGESTSPAYIPAVSEKAQVPARAVIQHTPIAAKAIGTRATQS